MFVCQQDFTVHSTWRHGPNSWKNLLNTEADLDEFDFSIFMKHLVTHSLTESVPDSTGESQANIKLIK